ncbi:MAG: hypothetical protein K6E22_09750 [Treponema sp.]|nr:hypothetical protein [Treponema sp.]
MFSLKKNLKFITIDQKMGRKISYTIWGSSKSSNDWLEWYEDVKLFFHSLEYELTHFGITGDTYNSGKILTFSRKEKEFIKKLESRIYPACVECYSLLPNYQTAMFDFNMACIRSESYISIVLKKEDTSSSIEKSVIELEKKYIIGTKGEIYSTSDKEVPMIYAETGDAKSLDTYKFIKRIKVD